MRSGHSSSPNKRETGSQSRSQGSTGCTGSQLLLAIVFTVFIVAFGYMFYSPAEEKVINSDSFYSLSISGKAQGDKTPSHPTTTTPSTPTTPPDHQSPNQTHPTNTTKPPETTTPSHPNNTSTTETPPKNQTTPTEPSSTTTQPTDPPPVIIPPPPADPHGISDGPTKEVIKNSGKRIKLDNPVQYEHIGYPSVQRESYIPHLEIQWTLYGPNHLSVVIRDADKDRFEIPFEEPYLRPRHPPLAELEDSNFELDIGTSPFSLKVKRRSTQEVIFELVDRLIYSDLYHEFTVRPPTKNYYGFGERTHGLQFSPGTYTLYIIDRSGHIDPGQPGYNTNGHQSMYLMAEKSKLYHLFLLRNTNSQEVVIKNNFDLTWKVVGGVLDFNFFLGETPEETVKLYHEYLGGWTLPALWHLGSHQCKWKGYKSVDVFQQVLEGYERVKLPLDGLWSDLDYTINEIPLTFDENKFPPQRTQELLKKYRKKWIPVINFYIPTQTESHAWTFPNVTSVAIRDGQDPSKPSPGTYYSGLVYFVDNFNPDSEAFWHQMYDFLSSKIPVSGLWLDANEVTTFMHINWPVANRQIYADHIAGDRNRKYYHLPFYPGNENAYDVPIVDVDALHYGGIDEFNVRSYNNFHQSRHAYSYLQKRGFYFPLVLTRGNTMGSGQFAYHFTPDIKSLWDHFRVSTGQVYMYNIYGMPMVGADICGMGGEQQTAPELCARWYQVATFYGFARNHHQPQNYYDNNQEPHRYSGIYLESISASILLRYSILKQFNALFFKKRRGLRGTGTLMRPVFMEFPHDAGLPEYGHNMHEDQFMFDDFMLVAPAVYPGQQSVNAYIPNWRWFDLRDYKESALRGKWGEVSAKVPELPPHFLRGGRILFKQDTEGVMIAADLSNTFKMIVALNDLTDTGSQASSEAYGHLMSASNYEEKYIYENCAIKDCMLKATVNYELNKQDHTTNISLKVESVVPGSTDDAVELDEVHVLGLDPESLENGDKVECAECESGEALQIERGDNWVKIKGMKIAFKDGVLYNFKLSKA